MITAALENPSRGEASRQTAMDWGAERSAVTQSFIKVEKNLSDLVVFHQQKWRDSILQDSNQTALEALSRARHKSKARI